MEPLHPELRQALKDAHPGLADEDIDRLEELLARRFSLDPETQTAEISRLDTEAAELQQRLMPHYREVTTAFAQQRITRLRAAEGPDVEIRIKPQDDRPPA
ncbi:MAG TPA: hypothetical protein VHJ17_26275 [Thermomonospora sp.]|nr:hypothetical protein [Thermomonospora sp.]